MSSQQPTSLAQQPVAYEYKHLEVPQYPELVNVITNTHAMFYWEVQATQTVVSKEVHLDKGEFDENKIYFNSVVTTERFVAIDFRRPNNVANLPQIKEVERQYFQLCSAMANLGCSPLNNYSSPPPLHFNIKLILWGFFFLFIPSVIHIILAIRNHKKAIIQWEELKPKLDKLLNDNKNLLSIPG